MAIQNFYRLLGAEPGATDAQIEAAYQHSSARLQERADAHGDDVQNQLKFLLIARETLLNKAKRAAYDASQKAKEAPRKPAVPVRPARPARRSTQLWALALVAVAIGAALLWHARKGAPAASVAVATPVPARHAPASPSVESDEPESEAAHLNSEALFDKTSQSVVVIYGLNGERETILQGSGVVVADQKVITNCHVAKSAAATVVKLAEHRYPAILSKVDADPRHDLCLLSVDGMHAPAVRLADIHAVKVGQKAFALGAPKGLELTMSDGIISSLRAYEESHFVQTTASISPGSSGGGLFDDTGALIGVTTFHFVEGQNLNFAVPADWVAGLLKKDDALASLGGDSLAQMEGKWRCEPSKGTREMLYQFGKDGDFALTYSDHPNVKISGSYAIMSNHTLVLKSATSDPPEVYVQILALDRQSLRVSSPFYDEAQTYQCHR
ncbi:MAG: trypsin-like peptidase domain-containing protein [Pseudomonadota bacterium]